MANNDIADRLVSALKQDEFVLYGQTIMSIARKPDDRPYHEILIRFQEEEKKLMAPGTFIPILEESHLMPYLDRWVVGRIVNWMRGARSIKSDWPLPRNSINLAGDTLTDPNFAEYVRSHLEIAKMPGDTLSFEVLLRDAAARTEKLCGLIAQLRPSGCTFTLADFAGDQVSFESAQEIKPDFVKISGGLIGRIHLSENEHLKADAINRKCHDMGMRTIAEHVESRETLEKLRVIGFDYAQGFGIGHPQPLL
jgi:Amt family ammonium transporter